MFYKILTFPVVSYVYLFDDNPLIFLVTPIFAFLWLWLVFYLFKKIDKSIPNFDLSLAFCLYFLFCSVSFIPLVVLIFTYFNSNYLLVFFFILSIIILESLISARYILKQKLNFLKSFIFLLVILVPFLISIIYFLVTFEENFII
jgi:hypothetical protein